MNTQLAEGLKSAGMIGVIARPAIVATILFGVWCALGRTNGNARARVSAWWWTVIFLAGWLITVWVLAVRGAFASLSSGSAIAQLAFVPLVILILLGAAQFAATRSAVLTAALDAAPLSWLVGIQVYRVLGLVFLLAWSRGFQPGYFALPAGIGDALVGVLAIPLALGLRSGTPFVRRLALGWNILGIVDTVNAVSMGVTSAVVQLQAAPSSGLSACRVSASLVTASACAHFRRASRADPAQPINPSAAWSRSLADGILTQRANRMTRTANLNPSTRRVG